MFFVPVYTAVRLVLVCLFVLKNKESLHHFMDHFQTYEYILVFYFQQLRLSAPKPSGLS